MRYIRIDGTDDPSGPIDFDDDVTRNFYSQLRTQALVDLFEELAPGAGVTILSADNQLQGVQFNAAHTNHMHAWITDPDGNN